MCVDISNKNNIYIYMFNTYMPRLLLVIGALVCPKIYTHINIYVYI